MESENSTKMQGVTEGERELEEFWSRNQKHSTKQRIRDCYFNGNHLKYAYFHVFPS